MPTTQPTNDQPAPEPGCIFEGHGGQYIYGYIVELAIDHGYSPTPEYTEHAMAEASEGNSTPGLDEEDIVSYEADAAEEYLNANVAKPEHSFGWHEGEYFYQPNTWWEDTF